MAKWTPGATDMDKKAHALMEHHYSPTLHGTTVHDGYSAFYNESRLYSVRHLESDILCLVYASSPYDAIECVKRMVASNG